MARKSRDAYPLAWPENWPRSEDKTSSQFRTTLPGALKNVQDELRKFAKDSGAEISDLLVSSNVSLADQRPDDAGVAIYFTWEEIPTCIAVDRYHRPEENLQAIVKCLEAERTKIRHGGINLVRAAFTGYMKLPPPADRRRWFEVLGVHEGSTQSEVTEAYKRLRSRFHPDKPGGSASEFGNVTAAFGEFEALHRARK